MSNNNNLDLNGLNPLSYLGVNPKTPVPFFSRSADPTSEDYDNFILGTMWLNTANENIWMLVSKANRIAVWVQLSAGSSGTMTSLTGNSGGLVMPLGGNVNVVGDGTTINVVGNPVTHTLTLSLVGGGTAAESFVTSAGTAIPNGSGVVNVIGAGATSTSASGNTITITSGGAAGITITGDTGGGLTGSSFTFTGGATGLSFGGAGTTETLTFAGITANGGTVSLATDAIASIVNIGTGAAAKTVTLGSTNTTSTTNLQSGSGGIKIPVFAEGALVTSSTGVISTVTGTAGKVLTANAPGVAPSFQPSPAATISIVGDTGGALTGSTFTFTGGTTGLSFNGVGTTETLTFAGITANGGIVNLGTDATANAINIGTVAGVGRPINIGNTTGLTGIIERVGTGNYSLDGVAASTYTIGASTTSGTISIGGSAQTGTITLGSSSSPNTVAIGTGTGATTVNIATGGIAANAVNIATGAVANAVTIGSTTGAASLFLYSGSAGIIARGVASVAVANKNYVTINTATGALGSDAGSVSNISITGDTGGAITGSSFTFAGGTTGLSFGGAGSTETLTFAGITANGGTVSLATDATTSTVNIGTGAGAKTVTLGSTNTTSTTNLQAGSGGLKIPAFAEGALVTSSTGVISTVTGTAGFVLTANAAGTAPSFQAATGGGILSATVTLTSSQIKNLHATPIQLLPAPGVGFINNIIEISSVLTYGGSNPFIAGAAQVVAAYYGTTVQIGNILENGPLTGTVSFANNTTGVAYGGNLTSFNNIAVNAYNPQATEISGNAANDNTLKVNILYTVAAI